MALFKKLCLAIKNKDLTQITEDIAKYILMSGLYLVYLLEIYLFLQSSQKKMKYLRI